MPIQNIFLELKIRKNNIYGDFGANRFILNHGQNCQSHFIF